MSTWYAIGATVVLVYLALGVWFVIQVIKAPLVDEDTLAISNPHQRMSGSRRSRWYRRRLRRSPEGPAPPPGQTDGEYPADLSRRAS